MYLVALTLDLDDDILQEIFRFKHQTAMKLRVKQIEYIQKEKPENK